MADINQCTCPRANIKLDDKKIIRVVRLESLIPSGVENDRFNFGLINTFPNGCGKFSKMVALANRQIPQGSTKWSSRVTSNSGGSIGASQMLNIIGEQYDIREFFSKAINKNNIPPLNSNWGNLIEGVTTRFAEISRQLKIFDGVTVAGANMSSCTVDGFSLIENGGLQVWEFKSVIFRYLKKFGSIHFRYVEQVEAQKVITDCDKSVYFEMKVIPCTIEQMLNPDVSKYQSFLNTRGIKVDSPKAYGYVKIESDMHFLHTQYCSDPIIGGECGCDIKQSTAQEISTFDQDKVAEIMGLVKGGNWRSGFELVTELTDGFIDKIKNESCEYIMPFVIMNTNCATSCTYKNIISLYGDRLIVAANMLKNFHSIVGKCFKYNWPDSFIDYLVELFKSNLKKFGTDNSIEKLTRNNVIKFMAPTFNE